ncbi:CocE/NonD family hydrolase [Sphingomonas sp.]|uniref:CocE/NonD family hydrolase n=1 Tax=Sphingomonas sp. TaxID=28214 RepID=UPI0025F030D5|nr:CocE/NonD family hydrolase [Sphingomonas sp.]MBV9529068.1 CocE/NonD family hydrolase [Sphingomonas sp.]
MSDDLGVFVPAYREPEGGQGLFAAFEPGTRVLPAGFRVEPRFAPLPVAIVMDKDVTVTLRDGITIYVDVLRPAGDEKVPVLVAWSPYGKSRGNAAQYVDLLSLLGLDLSKLSGLEKFEAPDPAWWVARGYAVCNPDPRGSYRSEGDIRWWSRFEGQDYHDLIEFLGVQDWCSGKVATCGNSWLAISQWFAAAERPPHLAAIAPWEGMSDIYRDFIMRGGFPDTPFPRELAKSLVGANMREDLIVEAEQHPLMDALWKTKIPAFENIDVPAYIVASYSQSIHTPGTFRAWRNIASKDKWLRVHNTMEWPDFYDEAHQADLLRFYDHFLKGAENGWRETPRVRFSILDLEGNDRVDVPAAEFPPGDFEQKRLYLDADAGALAAHAPADQAKASYDAESEDGRVSFTIRVEEPTEFVGYPKVRLWLEAVGSDDMDVFVFLQKLDVLGTPLEQFNVPNHGPKMEALTRNGAAILKYKGSNGRLRVSTRRLDEALSTDAIPVHAFDRVEKLAPGQVVPVDIDMFPVALALGAGEQLRLIVTGFHILGGVFPGRENVTADNHGRHVVHTGGDRASFLQLTARKPGT